MTRTGFLPALLVLTGCATTPPGPALTEEEQVVVALSRGEGAAVVDRLARLRTGRPGDLTLARQWAEAVTQAGRTDEALASLAGDATATGAYLEGLLRYSRPGEVARAIDAFRRAVALAPGQPELHLRLGVALLEAEVPGPEAVEALRTALTLAPDSPAAALPLAKALARAGDVKGAVEAIHRVVTGRPGPAEARTAQALMDQLSDPFILFPRAGRERLERALQSLEVMDLPQQAILELEELAQDFPDQGIVHALLGLAYLRLDDAGRAVDELNRAVDRAPRDGKNHLYLAQVYLSRQKPKVAEEHLKQAVALHPTLTEAWMLLGSLALERRDLLDARTAFTVATHLEPSNIPARGKLGLVHQLDRNWAAARAELLHVMELEPENVEFMLRLGVLHTEQLAAARDPAERAQAAREAARWLDEVLRRQPENALASRALQKVKATAN